MKIRFENVTFYYQNNLPEKKRILHNINLEINENEFVGIIGPSGSGKTTLVQHFTGLLKPTAGKVFINDADIFSNEININSIRRQIGIVFQFPESQLFEETVYDDIAFGPKNFGILEEDIDTRVKETFNLIGLDFEKMKLRSPFKLSEGEKRRIALAGILVLNPDVLILDEPTACLDAAGMKSIEQLLIKLHALGKAIIIVSHNLDFILKICKRVIVIQEGEIQFDGDKNKLITEENDLKILNLKIPRTVRFARKLKEIGYIDVADLYSLDEIKAALGV